jgi:hypothetical protein
MSTEAKLVSPSTLFVSVDNMSTDDVDNGVSHV